MQKSLENYFKSLAYLSSIKKDTIVVADRGCMDARAYVSSDIWQAILDQMDWNPVNLSHHRYEAVIHMVSAADGAEDFYTSENNAARYETVQEAKELDHKLQSCYVGHPRHIIIKNYLGESFDYKINRVIEEITQVLDLNIDGETMDQTASKYLLKPKGILLIFYIKLAEDFKFPENVQSETINVEETYLISKTLSDGEIEYRKLIKQVN